VPASRVEYRVFSASADPLGEERYPLALVHWDGRQLRYAARERLPGALEREERGLSRVLKALRRRVRSVPTAQLDIGLDHVFDVRDGDAGTTAWSPIRIARTQDAADHFERLVRDLRLAPFRDASSSIGRSEVVEALLGLGASLAVSHGAGVRIESVVEAFDVLRSPLSWLNGAWVHTMPLVLSSTSSSHEAVRKIAATLELAVPRTDRLVVAYPMPADEQLARELARGVEYLSSNNPPPVGPTPRVRSVGLPLASDDELDTAPLRSLVLAEIRRAA
jgi:hypothetical protein